MSDPAHSCVFSFIGSKAPVVLLKSDVLETSPLPGFTISFFFCFCCAGHIFIIFAALYVFYFVVYIIATPCPILSVCREQGTGCLAESEVLATSPLQGLSSLA